MSYSFGNVAKDSSLTNFSTNRSVSELSVSETVKIESVDLPNLPVGSASNILYIDPLTGIISRDVPVGGGSTGPTGSSGTPGVTGSVGTTGATGVTGAPGSSTLTGATGPVGTTGATGAQGIPGTNSNTGATGPVGTTGATGATGGFGGTGATGYTGNTGATGRTGATGPVGAGSSGVLQQINYLVQQENLSSQFATVNQVRVPGIQIGGQYTFPNFATGNNFWLKTATSSTANTLIVAHELGTGGTSFSDYYIDNGTGVYNFANNIALPTGATGSAQFLQVDVDLSSDGSYLIFGVPDDDTVGFTQVIGAVWTYFLTAGVYNQIGTKLTPTGAVGTLVSFGYSVSIANNNLLAVGGFGDNSAFNDINNGIGAVWMYNLNGAQQWIFAQKLIGTPQVLGANFGISVSLSSDGTTLAVGADGNLTNGAVFIYTLVGATWTQQQRIVGPSIASFYGYSVSLSNNGNTLAVGSNTNVYVYNRIGGSFTAATLSLPWDLVSTTASPPRLLNTIISGDGNSLIINNTRNVNYSNNRTGASWIYTQGPIGTWTQNGNALSPQPPSGNTGSTALSFSNNGARAVIGSRGPMAAGSTGATGGIWVFA